MQPERRPTQNLPPQPKPCLTLVTSDLDGKPPQDRTGRSNRLLAWSVLASLGVNALFVVLLSRADLFRHERSIEEVKHIRVQVYQTPIKRPVPPKPRTTVAPPPPTPRDRHTAHTPPVKVASVNPPPMMRPRAPLPPPLHTTTPATPMPTLPTPVAPRVSPPALVQHVTHTASPRRLPAAPPRLLPAPTGPVTPTTPHFSPPAPVPPVALPPMPAPPIRHDEPTATPVKHETPSPPPVRHEPPPPPLVQRSPPPVRHEEPKRPENWVPVDRQEAEVRSVPDPDVSGIDSAEIAGACVVSFEIGENGRVSNVRVRKSSGSHDFDRACQDAIRRARCAPAIQDHIPQMQRMTYSFSE